MKFPIMVATTYLMPVCLSYTKKTNPAPASKKDTVVLSINPTKFYDKFAAERAGCIK